MSDGPILKDWIYYTWWAFVLACGLIVSGWIIWLLTDIRNYLVDLLKVLARP